MSAKTEPPSPKRLRDARQKGNLARSQTLAAALASLCTLGALLAMAPAAGASLFAYTRATLHDAASGTLSASTAIAHAWEALAAASLPVLLAATLGALAGAGLQVGVLFNVTAVAPKLENLSLAKGFKRVFSVRSLVEALKALLITVVILWLAYAALRDGLRVVAGLPRLEAFTAMSTGFGLVRGLVVKALGAAILLGGFDYLYQRHAHLKGLMMSRDDLKQEHKQSEGDPHFKSKRKALHKSLANGTAARGVQKATVLVVNPTHVSVALRYVPKEAAAPTLVAKGTDEEAAKLRWLARRHRVPVVRDVPLARALVRFDVGEEVPEELYQAAAVVLRKVFEMGALPAEARPNRRSVR
ncbi:MAG TPA: flagellar biosynthesis protein FlhB [Myxococcales bacterium]|nr:flagellar biosynthesis protein FlhB [Myxococcales bacterium]